MRQPMGTREAIEDQLTSQENTDPLEHIVGPSTTYTEEGLQQFLRDFEAGNTEEYGNRWSSAMLFLTVADGGYKGIVHPWKMFQVMESVGASIGAGALEQKDDFTEAFSAAAYYNEGAMEHAKAKRILEALASAASYGGIESTSIVEENGVFRHLTPKDIGRATAALMGDEMKALVDIEES